jgi:carboxypeptidase C (cathepsin A)
MYSGFIGYKGPSTYNYVPENKVFYWLFENSEPDLPLIINLSGKGGIQNLFGIFEEGGPFKVS